MKLFTKYNRINILASILIFLGGCTAFYFVMDHILVKQLDEGLETEQAEIVQYVRQHKSLPEIVNTNDEQTFFVEINTPFAKRTYSFKKIFNKEDNIEERARQIVFGIDVSGRNYQVTIVKSQEGTEDLLKLIVLIASVMVALILLAGYIINRIALKKLWQPFYYSIKAIGNYKLQQQQALQLPSTNIEEFNLLNATMNNMVARAEQDYQVLKEFTGNAAHEMQTPLAVISTNTEALMQDEMVLQKHHSTISTIEDAAKRLSRLNHSLLLLTKIENRRYELNETIEWDVLLKQRLEDLNELASSQSLNLEIKTVPLTTIFHQQLADILISNLLGNAIRYNIDGGLLTIELTDKKLTIANTSIIPALDNQKIFSRFYRHPQTKAEGNGLGLSIVQQICNMAGYSLDYLFLDGKHFFTIHFK